MNNIYLELKSLFESNKDPQRSVAMARYMKDNFQFYGIPTPLRRELYKHIIKSEKKKKQIDYAFLDLCWNEECREFQYFVLDYLSAMHSLISFDDIPNIYRYIKSKQWWDSIDCLDKIVGNIGLKDERVNDLMLRWSTDSDFWVRRIAIDHQLTRKEKTNIALMEQIIINNFGSKEFFINKAIGWSLREYAKTNPTWVKQFIDTHKDRMSRLSIREGGKYIL